MDSGSTSAMLQRAGLSSKMSCKPDTVCSPSTGACKSDTVYFTVEEARRVRRFRRSICPRTFSAGGVSDLSCLE
jgi:hypothetical protein